MITSTNTVLTGRVTYRRLKQTEYQNSLWNINRKVKEAVGDQERDEETCAAATGLTADSLMEEEEEKKMKKKEKKKKDRSGEMNISFTRLHPRPAKLGFLGKNLCG